MQTLAFLFSITTELNPFVFTWQLIYCTVLNDESLMVFWPYFILTLCKDNQTIVCYKLNIYCRHKFLYPNYKLLSQCFCDYLNVCITEVTIRCGWKDYLFHIPIRDNCCLWVSGSSMFRCDRTCQTFDRHRIIVI